MASTWRGIKDGATGLQRLVRICLTPPAEFFAGGTQGVVVNLSNGVATDAYGDTDMLVEIERVYGTNFDDVFTGSDGSDGFDPHGGNDQIDGGDGWDGLYYHNAINVGGAGGIIVEFSTTVEGSGTVLIDPFGDTDIFTGIESISGTNSVDYITGGIGFQQISTRAGNDIIDGTIGLQEVSYSNDASRGGFGGIFVDMEILDLQGFASATDGFGDTDLLKDIEQVRGTGTLDTILGDGADNSFEGRAGDDFLSGRAGSDYLNGGADMDTIDGGADNDWLVGGSEADIFEFEAGDGYDTIEDFAVGEDSLFLLGGLTIVSLSEADVGGEVGPDTIVLLSTGEEITLLNVSGVADANDLL